MATVGSYDDGDADYDGDHADDDDDDDGGADDGGDDDDRVLHAADGQISKSVVCTSVPRTQTLGLVTHFLKDGLCQVHQSILICAHSPFA